MSAFRPRWVFLVAIICAAAMAAVAAGPARQPAGKKPAVSKAPANKAAANKAAAGKSATTKSSPPKRTAKVQQTLALTPDPVDVAPSKPKGEQTPATEAPPAETPTDAPSSPDDEPTALDPDVAAEARPEPTAASDLIEEDDADVDEPATPAPAKQSRTNSDPLPPVIVAAKPRVPSGNLANSFELRYKFQPNEVVRTEVVHRATVETTIKGTSQTAETRTTSIKIWHISPTSTATQFSFIHGVEEIDMWQHTKGREEVQYNSRTDKTPPPGYEEVAKAVGVPLTEVTIDARGNVLKRKEVHPQSNANPAPPTMPLPEKPVAIGESWSHPLDLDVLLSNGGGTKKIPTRQKFTLESVSSGIATIHVDTDALAAINDPAIEAQLIQRLPNGTIRFDIDAGRVISQQMDVDKRVIGFNGPASSMHYLSRFTEEYKSGGAATADRATSRK